MEEKQMGQLRVNCRVRIIPMLLLATVVSCGKEQLPVSPTGSTDPDVAPEVKSTVQDHNGVGSKDDLDATEDVGPTAADDSTVAEVSGNLPPLRLLEDPAFQMRAKLGHLVAKRRCILCHKVDGRGAILQPPLVQVSVRRLERMNTISEHLTRLQADDPDRYQARVDLFNSIEAEPDQLRKMSIWLHGYLSYPTFDNADAKMPLQVLKPEEIDQLASYVIQLAIEGVKSGVSGPE
jgi:mono/diheme cytochrome c family protein